MAAAEVLRRNFDMWEPGLGCGTYTWVTKGLVLDWRTMAAAECDTGARTTILPHHHYPRHQGWTDQVHQLLDPASGYLPGVYRPGPPVGRPNHGQRRKGRMAQTTAFKAATRQSHHLALLQEMANEGHLLAPSLEQRLVQMRRHWRRPLSGLQQKGGQPGPPSCPTPSGGGAWDSVGQTREMGCDNESKGHRLVSAENLNVAKN